MNTAAGIFKKLKLFADIFDTIFPMEGFKRMIKLLFDLTFHFH